MATEVLGQDVGGRRDAGVLLRGMLGTDEDERSSGCRELCSVNRSSEAEKCSSIHGKSLCVCTTAFASGALDGSRRFPKRAPPPILLLVLRLCRQAAVRAGNHPAPLEFGHHAIAVIVARRSSPLPQCRDAQRI